MTTAKKIILEELEEQMHPEQVEDVIFWALTHYAKKGDTWGSTIASSIVKRIIEEEAATTTTIIMGGFTEIEVGCVKIEQEKQFLKTKLDDLEEKELMAYARNKEDFNDIGALVHDYFMKGFNAAKEYFKQQ